MQSTNALTLRCVLKVITAFVVMLIWIWPMSNCLIYPTTWSLFLVYSWYFAEKLCFLLLDTSCIVLERCLLGVHSVCDKRVLLHPALYHLFYVRCFGSACFWFVLWILLLKEIGRMVCGFIHMVSYWIVIAARAILRWYFLRRYRNLVDLF